MPSLKSRYRYSHFADEGREVSERSSRWPEITQLPNGRTDVKRTLCHCFFAIALLSSRFHWSFSRIDFTVTLEDGAKAVLRRGLPADDNSSFTLALSREGRDKALFSASWWGCDSAPSPGRLEHTALAEVCVLSLRAVDGLHASLVCHRYCSQYGVFRCRFRGSLGIIVF